MLFNPIYARCDPIFGMDGAASLNLAISMPIPNTGARHDVLNSYRLEESDMIFPIHTLSKNKHTAKNNISINSGVRNLSNYLGFARVDSFHMQDSGIYLPIKVLAASMIFSSLGMNSTSSAGENGTGVNGAATLKIGASR